MMRANVAGSEAHSSSQQTVHSQEQDSEILQLWRRFCRFPAGARLFSRVAGWRVPYAGSITPEVESLEYGRAAVAIRDRRRLRNHIGTVHAVAIVNLAEFTANIALTTMQPTSGRWILTGIEADYTKKARGRLTAHCSLPVMDWSERSDVGGEVSVRDEAGDEVVRMRTRWLIGPKKDRQ